MKFRFSGWGLALWTGGAVIGLAIFAGACLQFWILNESKWVRTDAKPAVRSVLRAYLWSKFSGSYWENEMLVQSGTVAKLPLGERMDFYKEIVIHCDLDTSRALLFVEMVGNDDRSLYLDLEKFKASARFTDLGAEQRERVEDWIIELRDISKAGEIKIN